MTLTVDISGKHFAGETPDQNRGALKPVRFDVAYSSFTCIVGPSGCGKTTLMNIVGGLEAPDSGRVLLDGLPAADSRIGYMFQTPRLMPWLSVIDNVRLVMDKSQRGNGQAENLLNEMGLGDSTAVYANRLSGGMQRRAALARAFVNQPQLLLMDEPFVSLDDPAANKLRRLLLRSWNEQPTTVLFVTHNLHEALFLADRILFLSPGPGEVVLDYPVPLSRPRELLNNKDVDDVRDALLTEHPDLLKGLTNGATAA